MWGDADLLVHLVIHVSRADPGPECAGLDNFRKEFQSGAASEKHTNSLSVRT